MLAQQGKLERRDLRLRVETLVVRSMVGHPIRAQVRTLDSRTVVEETLATRVVARVAPPRAPAGRLGELLGCSRWLGWLCFVDDARFACSLPRLRLRTFSY